MINSAGVTNYNKFSSPMPVLIPLATLTLHSFLVVVLSIKIQIFQSLRLSRKRSISENLEKSSIVRKVYYMPSNFPIFLRSIKPMRRRSNSFIVYGLPIFLCEVCISFLIDKTHNKDYQV